MPAQPATVSGASNEPNAPEACRRKYPGAHLTVMHLRGTYKRRVYEGKESLYHEGETIDRVFVIRHGLVKLLSYLPNGRARIIRLHCGGHVLGLEGVLGRHFEHTAVAVNNVEVECVPLQRILRLERDDPRVLTALLYQWHDALAQADKWIAEFSTGEIKSRVARLLQYLPSLDGGRTNATVGLLTVGEIGEILGATPESVSRHLAAFKRQDILRREAGSSPNTYRLDVERVQQEARV